MGKQASSEYNDDTLVRSEDFGAQQSQYSTQSTEGGDAAISYGTSPEWVEVDGMIVSRSGTTVHLTNPLNSLHNSATSRSNAKTTNSHGSVLSLPYSSRTLLTYNSPSSTQRSSG